MEYKHEWDWNTKKCKHCNLPYTTWVMYGQDVACKQIYEILGKDLANFLLSSPEAKRDEVDE